MSRTLFVTALAADSGKAEAVAGLMDLVKGSAKAPVLFRPVPSLDNALELINSGKGNELIDSVLAAYKEASANADFVLCEGTDFAGRSAAFAVSSAAELNAFSSSSIRFSDARASAYTCLISLAKASASLTLAVNSFCTALKSFFTVSSFFLSEFLLNSLSIFLSSISSS